MCSTVTAGSVPPPRAPLEATAAVLAVAVLASAAVAGPGHRRGGSAARLAGPSGPGNSGATVGFARPSMEAAIRASSVSAAVVSSRPTRSMWTIDPSSPSGWHSATRTGITRRSSPSGSFRQIARHSALPYRESARYAGDRTGTTRADAGSMRCMPATQSVPGTRSHFCTNTRAERSPKRTRPSSCQAIHSAQAASTPV